MVMAPAPASVTAPAPQKVYAFAYGILGENGDTWFLRRPHDFLDIDLPPGPEPPLLSSVGKTASIIGHMQDPPSLKLIGERMVFHEAIAGKAFELHQENQEEPAEINWLRAERELLGLSLTMASPIAEVVV